MDFFEELKKAGAFGSKAVLPPPENMTTEQAIAYMNKLIKEQCDDTKRSKRTGS